MYLIKIKDSTVGERMDSKYCSIRKVLEMGRWLEGIWHQGVDFNGTILFHLFGFLLFVLIREVLIQHIVCKNE